MLRRRAKTLFLFVLASLTSAHAQYEVPNEIFQRTLLIRSGKDQATALKFDQGGQIYLVTTRHFGKNLPPKQCCCAGMAQPDLERPSNRANPLPIFRRCGSRHP